MPVNPLLEKVKNALWVSDNDMDSNILDLIEEAEADMDSRGIKFDENTDANKRHAVVLYCQAHFGMPENLDQLIQLYEKYVHQLQVTDGYTEWGDET